MMTETQQRLQDTETSNRDSATCPCLLIAAPSSGSGKTTLTAALARWHVNQGRTVRIFKAGPDYIDPMILQQAASGAPGYSSAPEYAGAPVYSLDLGMMSEAHCRNLLYRAAKEADLILIEGVMGLFDGKYSAALIAKTFALPVLAVVDARAMAETFAAVIHGLTQFDTELQFWGCAANRIASPRHEEMVRQATDSSASSPTRFLGSLPRDPAISFPERHLGLAQAEEIQDLSSKLDAAARHIVGQPLAQLPPAVTFTPAEEPFATSTTLSGKTIAVARDQAFSFVYAANLDFLRNHGAKLVFTSPLQDSALPPCDCLYLPGGYPELHVARLSANQSYLDSVRNYSGKILAECGGMIYLSSELTLLNGEHYSLCNRLPVTTQLHDRLQAIGWQHSETEFGRLSGHSFHYSNATVQNSTIATHKATTHTGKPGEDIYYHGNIMASYLHWYFYSNSEAALSLFT